MKTVTENFKNSLNQPRQIDANIEINGTSVSINKINGITRTFYSNLFKTVMKTLVLDTNNQIDLKQVVNPKFGLRVSGEFEYVPLGNFTTMSSEKNEDTLSYETKANDIIVESMIAYDLVVDYPISVRNYWVAIFNRLGWNTSGIPETFINSTKMINQDVHSGIDYTFRDVLDELCTISCAFLLEKNGVPTISYPSETNVVIDEKYMQDNNVKIKEKVFFNALVFSRAEESDNIFRKSDTSIQQNGLHELRIEDNQLLSTNDRVNYIDEMWDYLKNFEYYSFDIDTRGVIFLEPIDKFSLKIGNNTYSTILLNSELQIFDGVVESIYSDSPKNTITEYKYASKTDKTQKKTFLLIDKQNGKIQAVVNEQSNQSSKLSQLEISNGIITEQVSSMQTTIDETTNAVVEIENKVTQTITDSNAQFEIINSTLENGVEKLKNSLVSIDINGINVQFNYEKFKTLMTNKNFVVKDGTNEIAFFGYDENLQKTIARIRELETERVTAGYHRCEGFTDGLENRTGWFHIGGVN